MALQFNMRNYRYQIDNTDVNYFEKISPATCRMTAATVLQSSIEKVSGTLKSHIKSRIFFVFGSC
jgi:hypothetical protein